jgi:TonB-dependent starch-binding outer membrane protein SusC
MNQQKKRISFLMSLLSIALLNLFSVAAFSQATVVTGTVTDTANAPLSGVSVTVTGTKTGTTTDANGKFSISVKPNATLSFSYVGLQAETINPAGKNVVNVQMRRGGSDLNDVVVIGYASVKRKDVTGSVASISAKDIENRPIARLEEAMAGQMSGVQVQSVSGTPGAALQIRVRGVSSVSSSNDPIYVVDGVLMDDLNNIDPTTIQSIDVLKDASSAAIYGARGSNGVVLITTKRGNKGRPKISFSSNFAYQRPEKLVPMLSPEQWIQFKKDLTDSSWVNYGRQRGLNYSASDPMDFRASELNRLNPTATKVYNTHAAANPTYMYDPLWAYGTDSLDYIDWQKEFFSNPAYMQKYNLSASGSNENVSYLISGEYLDQKGMVVNTGYKRASFRSNLEVKLNDALKIGLNLSPSISWQDGAGIDGRGGIGPAVAGTAPIQEKGVGVYSGRPGTTAYRWAADQVSPVFQMEETLNNTQLIKLLTSAYINATLAKGLSLNVTGAWNSSSSDWKNYIPTSVSSTRRTAAPGSQSTARRNTSRSQYYQFQSVLSYDKKFGDHTINAIAGFSADQNDFASTTQTNSKLPNDNLYTFDLGTSTPTASSSFESQRRLLSTFGRVIYNYRSKYIVSASMRRDGSSRFGSNYKYGNFPAASIAWRVLDEPFADVLKGSFTDLKLRYSWGIAGNDRISGGDYPSISAVNATTYSFGGQPYTGYSVTSISSPDLRWERTTSNNIGLDVAVLKNKISVAVDYYNKLTTDVLLRAPVALVTGFATENQNVGSVRNKGVEVNITTNNITKPQFRWTSRLNYSFNKNEVVALTNNNTPIYTGWESTVKIAVGRPLYTYMLYDAIGVYTTPESLTKNPKMVQTIIGDPMYRDVNGDGKIDASDITEVGSPIPTYFWGFTNTVNYKRFDLSVLLQGQGGNKIFSMFGRNIDRPTTGLGNYNAKAVWANRFRSVESPGDGVTPRIDATTAGVYDTRWLYDGAFWKVKNLTLGYNLPNNLIKGIQNSRVYVSIDNLWMHDKYTGGYSPEAFQYDYLADWTSYPTAKTYSVGINIGL